MPTPDDVPMVTVEELVLNKFDGDPPKKGEDKKPAETIVLRNDEVVRHVMRDEVLFDKEQGVDKRPAKDRGKPYRPYPEEKK